MWEASGGRRLSQPPQWRPTFGLVYYNGHSSGMKRIIHISTLVATKECARIRRIE